MKLTRTLAMVSRSTLFVAVWMTIAAVGSHSQVPPAKKPLPRPAAAPIPSVQGHMGTRELQPGSAVA